ncbi:ADP-ribose diphosphatase [Psychromonas sp. psych-6C06]|uniref:ADP-ribose diphosphatase n=1 Tax=Psychromonas sp. psych-6C06 TaxID=2058089 RepID=UPI000C31F464|nr:ADP-ribose diphosphatase [Psychromonas sp. psych-6C06]PKF61671.1 ADP-ribose diphosphatase [Psychromonas sp. psych-6C06]
MNKHSLLSGHNEATFGKKDLQILDKKPLYNGFFQCNKYTFKHKLFAGGWSPEIQREIFERGHAAAVLPYDKENDAVVLIEQFRFGAIETELSPWLLELVAGIIEPGEEAVEVIQREAQEEAGLIIESSQFIMNCLLSPGGSTEHVDIFVGAVDSTKAQGLHGLEEEGEDIRVHVVPRETAYQWVLEGKINNSATVIALLWLQINKDNGLTL